MQSTMMDFPLTLAHILTRAGSLFGNVEIVSRLPDKSLHRYHYRDFHRRAQALGGALQAAGLRKGDCVATLMWNHYAHLEAYFAIPCAGGVCTRSICGCTQTTSVISPIMPAIAV